LSHVFLGPQLQRNLVTSALGLNEDFVDVLARNLGMQNYFEADLLQRLRSLPRDETAKELNKVPKGTLKSISIRDALDALYAIPRVTVIATSIQHSVDKESNKSVGILYIKLEVDQQAHFSKTGSATDLATIVIILGTLERRFYLGKAEFSVGRGSGKTVTEKEIKFDWNIAIADGGDGGDGGGTMLLHILPDNIRGMDSGMLVKLR
jgi:hypothetical protein